MSNLLWDVPAWEGGSWACPMRRSMRSCEEHRGTVSREIALNAQWARTVTWPRRRRRRRRACPLARSVRECGPGARRTGSRQTHSPPHRARATSRPPTTARLKPHDRAPRVPWPRASIAFSLHSRARRGRVMLGRAWTDPRVRLRLGERSPRRQRSRRRIVWCSASIWTSPPFSRSALWNVSRAVHASLPAPPPVHRQRRRLKRGLSEEDVG